MSLQNQTQIGITEFSINGISSANTQQTITIPADTAALVGFTNSMRQIVIVSIDIYAINASATAITASSILTITTTGFQGTPSWAFPNGFPAWSSTSLLQRFYASLYGALIVPFVTGGAAQSAATIVIPALGANVTSYAAINGVYV